MDTKKNYCAKNCGATNPSGRDFDNICLNCGSSIVDPSYFKRDRTQKQMKISRKLKFFLPAAIFIFFSFMLHSIFLYKSGYEKGANDGFIIALDTVNSILDKQLMQKDTVTKMTLISPDTNEYILSTKTILKK